MDRTFALAAVAALTFLALPPVDAVGSIFPPCPPGETYVPGVGCVRYDPGPPPPPPVSPRECPPGFFIQTGPTSTGPWTEPPKTWCADDDIVLGPYFHNVQWGRLVIRWTYPYVNIHASVTGYDATGASVWGESWGPLPQSSSGISPAFYIDPKTQAISISAQSQYGDWNYHLETHGAVARACLPGTVPFARPSESGGQYHNVCRPVGDLAEAAGVPGGV